MNFYYRWFVTVCVSCITIYASLAQPCRLVADVRMDSNNQSALVFMDEFTVVGDQVYFSGSECQQSPELYILDTKKREIRMVKNTWDRDADPYYAYCGVDPVWYFTRPRNLCAGKQGQVFFTGLHAELGSELWVTDGSIDGTQLVKEIAPGGASSFPKNLVAFQEGILFTAEDAQKRNGLWSSDGTEAGTVLIQDMAAVNIDNIYELTVADSLVYFRASNSNGSSGLWRTDGTTLGTFQIEQMPGGASGGSPGNLKFVGGNLFYNRFYTQTSSTKVETWVTNGSPGSAVQLHPGDTMPYGLAFGGFTELNGKVLFAAYTSEFGNEIWQTDGTPDGTTLLKDCYAGVGSGDPRSLTRLGNRLLFEAAELGQSRKIWSTDGTEAGTLILNNFTSGGRIMTHGNKAYFIARSPFHPNWTIWQTDGTSGGTELLGGAFSTVRHAFVLQSGLMVLYASGPDNVYRWWYTDLNTRLIESVQPIFMDNGGGLNSGLYQKIVALGDQVIFVAHDGNSAQVYRAEKGKPGAEPLTAFDHPYYFFGPNSLVANGNQVYFRIQVGYSPSVFETWKTDGTPNGTGPVLFDAGGSGISSNASIFTTFNQDLILRGAWNDSAALWRYNPLTDSSVFLHAFSSFSHPSFIPIQVGDKFYFTARQTAGSEELWASDGTPDGTYLVKSFGGGERIYRLFSDGQLLFFKADDGQYGEEPWRSDGTPAGTFMLADIHPTGPSNPYGFTALNGLVYFIARDTVQNVTLWQTDGSTAGTVLATQLPPSSDMLTSFAGRLFFVAEASLYGKELWTSDGTAAGTNLFLDILHGKYSAQPDQLTVFDSLLFFTAYSPEHGRELWQTDGTPQGTKMVQDIIPGPGSSSPLDFSILTDRLYFSAYAPDSGRELWVYMPTGATQVKSEAASLHSGFQLVPNPASIAQGLTIQQTGSNTTAEQAILLDITGRPLRQWMLTAQTFNQLDLAGIKVTPGMYLIQLTGKSGEPLAVLKCLLID
ncbi:MAG: T9SS type A sorting domain-containing protein [Saprospiraceae bacterium]|nr:T9SS type A sorting domain-containing protein [Saprospiraceae bacterium]